MWLLPTWVSFSPMPPSYILHLFCIPALEFEYHGSHFRLKVLIQYHLPPVRAFLPVLSGRQRGLRLPSRSVLEFLPLCIAVLYLREGCILCSGRRLSHCRPTVSASYTGPLYSDGG